MSDSIFDCIVAGGGHAGSEAAVALARMGHISLTDSSIRWLKLSRPATTMMRRRPFCSAEPVKP